MITLDEAKEFLRIDHAEEDGYISVLLLLANEMCLNYMRQVAMPTVIPIPVKQAQLLIIAHFYENRNGEPVPDVVFRLLDAYRKEEF